MTTKEKYIAFCTKHAVPLFFTPFWMNRYDNEWYVLHAAEEEDFAFFIYHIERKVNFKIIRNGFLNPYTGFLFSDNSISAVNRQKLIHKILGELPAFHELHLDLHPDVGTGFDFGHFKTEQRITNILPLNSIEEIFSAYKPPLKRQINKARKNLAIFEEDNISLFYSLHEKTFLKQDRKAITPFEAFENTWNVCRQYNCGKLLFVSDEYKNIHAAIFMTYDENYAYYLAGGTDAEFYGSGAMSYLMHTAISIATELNKKFFDFEGSMLPGVNRFFRNFSPVETPYTNLSKMDSVLLKVLKKFR